MPIRTIALSGLALLLAGCNDGLSTARERSGFVAAVALDAGGSTYAMEYLGAFYRYNGLSADLGELETCIAIPYSPIAPPIATLPTMEAGEGVYLTLSGRDDTLRANTDLGITSYSLVGVKSVPYTPGDTLTLTVPGDVNGFPPATVKVRTAEPFTFDPVGNPADAEPLTVTWTAATEPGSTIVFRLRLSNTASPDPNTEIICIFADDGSGEVGAIYADVWADADPASKSVAVERVRQGTVVIDERTKLTVSSFFDQPIRLATP